MLAGLAGAWALPAPATGLVRVTFWTPGGKDWQFKDISTLGVWADDHNWVEDAATGKYSGTVTAKGGPASLEKLALLITRQASDWTA